MRAEFPDLPRLDRHFQLGERLGEGGFGVVHRGIRLADRTPVALKVPHQDLAPGEVRRILREAELVRPLEHRHLARFLGLFQDPPRSLVLAYELIEGEDLGDLLPSTPPSPEEQTRGLRWISELGQALDALHRVGLIHRDVKPENARVQPDGTLKLLDFGLLRTQEGGSTVTATGILLGTPAYMAPELFRGEPPTAASDRYALACLAYRVLRGHSLLGGAPEEVARIQLHGAEPRVREALRELPPELGPLLARGLSPDPGERPPSCAAFHRELEQALAGSRPSESVSSGGPPGPTRPLVPARTLGSPRILGSTRTAALAPTPRKGLAGPSRVPRWPLLLALALGVGIGGLLLRDTEGPGTSPGRGGASSLSPVLPSRGSLVELTADLDQGLERWLDEEGRPSDRGRYPLLHEDPLRWELVAEQLPGLRAVLRELPNTSRPLPRGAPELAPLERLDRLLRGVSLPTVLEPLVEWAPATHRLTRTPEEIAEEIEGDPDPGGPLRFSGWEVTTLELLEQANRLSERYLGELRGTGPGRPRIVETLSDSALLFHLHRKELDLIVDGLYQQKTARVLLFDWLGDGVRITRGLLVAGGLALRAAPPGDSEAPRRRESLVSLLTHLFLVEMPSYLHLAGGVTGLGPYLGPPPETLEGHYFRGTVLHLANKQRRNLGLPVDVAEEQRSFRRLLAAPPSWQGAPAYRWIPGLAVSFLAASFRRSEDYRGLRSLVREVREDALLSPRSPASGWNQLATSLLAMPSEERARLPGEDLRWILGVFEEIQPEEHPEWSRHQGAAANELWVEHRDALRDWFASREALGRGQGEEAR